MKIGIRSGAYGADEEIGMRAHGFEALNYTGFASLKSPLYTMPEDELRSFLTAKYEKAHAAGIVINQTHGPCPTDDSTEESRRRNLELVRCSMRGTVYLHARDFVIHPLMPFGHDADDPEMIHALNLDYVRTLLPEARQMGIRLVMENMPYPALKIAHMEEIVSIAREINDESFGVCLDTGHAACIGDDPADMVRIAGDKLYTLHVHDNNLKYDLHLLPFAGKIDWQAFRDALREVGFDGVVSIETSVGGHVPEPMRTQLQKATADAALWIAGRI